jgi:hypothetical protein
VPPRLEALARVEQEARLIEHEQRAGGAAAAIQAKAQHLQMSLGVDGNAAQRGQRLGHSRRLDQRRARAARPARLQRAHVQRLRSQNARRAAQGRQRRRRSTAPGRIRNKRARQPCQPGRQRAFSNNGATGDEK